jgi:hypothetical protein
LATALAGGAGGAGLCFTPAVELAWLHSGELLARELLDVFLDWIRRVCPWLSAIIALAAERATAGGRRGW